MRGESNVSKSLFTRIALLQTGVLVLLLVCLGWIARSGFRGIYLSNVKNQMNDMVELFSKQLPSEAYEKSWCQEIAQGTQLRISLVSSQSGHRICDSNTPQEMVSSVLDQPELQSALESPSHRGGSVRMSVRLGNLEVVYSTLYIPERKLILRVGLTIPALQQTLQSFDRLLVIAISILSLALAIVLQWTGRRIVFTRTTRELDRSKGKIQDDFVANVSHEFRTPLTSIRGFADTLLKDADAGKAIEREFVKIILKDSERLLGMVNDLMDLSSIQAGSMEIVREEVDTESITQEALKRLQMVHGDQRHQIEVHAQAPMVMADSGRMLQILINLVGNSMKFCPPESVIKIEWKNTSNDSVQLFISDNGPGISEEDQLRIFQRFARGKNMTKSPGAGLGLAIVKELVAAHEGTIRFSSKRNEGTLFILTFPTVHSLLPITELTRSS